MSLARAWQLPGIPYEAHPHHTTGDKAFADKETKGQQPPD